MLIVSASFACLCIHYTSFTICCFSLLFYNNYLCCSVELVTILCIMASICTLKSTFWWHSKASRCNLFERSWRRRVYFWKFWNLKWKKRNLTRLAVKIWKKKDILSMDSLSWCFISKLSSSQFLAFNRCAYSSWFIVNICRYFPFSLLLIIMNSL